MDLEKGIQLINIDDIIPNRFQPRLAFDERELKELSESIKQHGIIQPLVLRQIGEKYEIIAGERRYKASCLAGLKQVPAIIMNVDDGKSAELAVVENIQRKDLTAVEEAQSYKKLLDKGMTQEELATKLGVAQSTVANKVRLLALDDEIQQALLSNKISERHARSMLQIMDRNIQKQILRRIIEERLTVKQTDEIINKILGKNTELNEVAAKEDIFDLNVDNIKNNAEDLFKEAPEKSFEDLMKKQDEITIKTIVEEPVKVLPEIDLMPKVELPRPIFDTSLMEEKSEVPYTSPIIPETQEIKEKNEVFETPEILDFDSSIKDPLSMPEEIKISEPEILIQEEYKPNQIIEEFRNQQPQEMSSIPEPVGNSLGDAINSAREFKNTLTNKGFRVNTEEFDFEDMYQIVIKIQKD